MESNKKVVKNMWGTRKPIMTDEEKAHQARLLNILVEAEAEQAREEARYQAEQARQQVRQQARRPKMSMSQQWAMLCR
jgi:hypothetical protein